MTEQKYKYTLDSSFESAYSDCKSVDGSIIDERSYQECDTGLVLAHMDRILEALGKQIPKKPLIIGMSWDNDYECPICGNSVTDYFNRKLKYCRECGQKILWENE